MHTMNEFETTWLEEFEVICKRSLRNMTDLEIQESFPTLLQTSDIITLRKNSGSGGHETMGIKCKCTIPGTQLFSLPGEYARPDFIIETLERFHITRGEQIAGTPRYKIWKELFPKGHKFFGNHYLKQEDWLWCTQMVGAAKVFYFLELEDAQKWIWKHFSRAVELLYV